MQWYWITVLDILSYLIGIWALFTIPANRKPGEATAWLLLIFLAPILGAALFLLLGSPKLSRWRRKQQQNMNERIKEFAEAAEHTPALAPIVDPPLSVRYEPHVSLITQLTGMPVMAGNTVELLPDYIGAVDQIVRDIDAAQRFVHLEYYMFADDAIGAYTESAIDTALTAAIRGDASNQVSRFAYDANNRVRFTVDALGAVTESVYDTLGNMKKAVRYAAPPIGLTAYTESEIDGKVDRNDASNQMTLFAYDANNALLHGGCARLGG